MWGGGGREVLKAMCVTRMTGEEMQESACPMCAKGICSSFTCKSIPTYVLLFTAVGPALCCELAEQGCRPGTGRLREAQQREVVSISVRGVEFDNPYT